MASDDPASDLTVPLVAESAVVTKEVVTAGRVRVSTHVEVRRELVEETLKHDDVIVERVEIGEVVQVAPEVRMDGDVLVYPIVEEILVVEKRLVLKEELRISRRSHVETVEHEVTLRNVRVDVERTPTDHS